MSDAKDLTIEKHRQIFFNHILILSVGQIVACIVYAMALTEKWISPASGYVWIVHYAILFIPFWALAVLYLRFATGSWSGGSRKIRSIVHGYAPPFWSVRVYGIWIGLQMIAIQFFLTAERKLLRGSSLWDDFEFHIPAALVFAGFVGFFTRRKARREAELEVEEFS